MMWGERNPGQLVALVAWLPHRVGGKRGTHTKPDVDLLDLLDLTLGVQRVGELERRLERLGLLLCEGPSSDDQSRHPVGVQPTEEEQSTTHLLADEQVDHLDGALQLGDLLLEPGSPLEARLFHELVLAACVRALGELGREESGRRARERGDARKRVLERLEGELCVAFRPADVLGHILLRCGCGSWVSVRRGAGADEEGSETHEEDGFGDASRVGHLGLDRLGWCWCWCARAGHGA